LKQHNNQSQPKYILGGQLPENSIMGAVGTDTIRSNGTNYSDDFVTEFAKAIARYFKDNPDKVQDKGESA
jgi:hypothetical protein